MILGIYGYQDAGKTTLVEELIRSLVKKGYSVSSVKHTSHATSVDTKGKDTWRHWTAGSDPVIFSSSIETSIIKHSQISADRLIKMIMQEFQPDVLLVEGWKEADIPKVSLGKVEKKKGTVMRNPSLRKLIAYVEVEVKVERVMARLPGLDCGRCGLDCERMARQIVSGKKNLGHCVELPKTGVLVKVGGERLALTKFPASFVEDTVRGMLSSLKGYTPGKEVEIRLEADGKTARRRPKK